MGIFRKRTCDLRLEGIEHLIERFYISTGVLTTIEKIKV
jgi:hypothetical protein